MDVDRKRAEARQRALQMMKRDTPGNKMSDKGVNELINREIHLYRRRRKATDGKKSAKRSF